MPCFVMETSVLIQLERILKINPNLLTDNDKHLFELLLKHSFNRKKADHYIEDVVEGERDGVRSGYGNDHSMNICVLLKSIKNLLEAEKSKKILQQNPDYQEHKEFLRRVKSEPISFGCFQYERITENYCPLSPIKEELS